MAKRPGVVYVGKSNQAILNGTDDLSDWTEEELIRGTRRGRNGRWMGRPPKVVPKVVHDEWVRRKFAKSYDLMQQNLVEAVQELCKLALNAKDETVRLKAIDLLMKHTLPPKPEHLTIRLEPRPYEQVRRSIIDREIGDYDAIEVDVVDDDD